MRRRCRRPGPALALGGWRRRQDLGAGTRDVHVAVLLPGMRAKPLFSTTLPRS
jgi:hypothetical protein